MNYVNIIGYIENKVFKSKGTLVPSTATSTFTGLKLFATVTLCSGIALNCLIRYKLAYPSASLVNPSNTSTSNQHSIFFQYYILFRNAILARVSIVNICLLIHHWTGYFFFARLNAARRSNSTRMVYLKSVHFNLFNFNNNT